MDREGKVEGEANSGCFRGCLSVSGFFLFLLVLILVLPVASYFLLWGLGGYLVVGDRVEPVDAIVVLSSGISLDRLGEAAALYHEGVAPRIILTETEETYLDTDTTHSSLNISTLKDLGVPEDAIILSTTLVTSTWGEARVVRKLMLRENFTSCLVVTDPFHTRRTRVVFTEEFSAHALRALVRPVRESWYRSNTWWMSEEGRSVTVSEYAKLIGYLFGLREDVQEEQ